MAETGEVNKSLGKPLIIGGVLLGGGCLAFLGIKAITDYFSKAEETKQMLLDEIFLEMQDAEEYQNDIIEAGGMTDAQRQLLDQKLADINWKVLYLDELNHNWLVDFVDELGDWAKSFGLYLIIPTVATGLVARYFWTKFKKWPPYNQQPPPDPNPGGPDLPPSGGTTLPPVDCPICGLTFISPEALADHIRSGVHPISVNVSDINAAQSYFNQQPATTKAIIQVEAGAMGISSSQLSSAWVGLSAAVLLAILAAIAISCTAGAPAVGLPAAYNVVAQAESILVNCVARSLVLVAA